MGDLFTELIVPRKQDTKDKVLKILSIALGVVVLLAGFLSGNMIILAVAIILIMADFYYLIPRFNVEYEYSYVNGEIDVARIYSKQSRKEVASISLENVECIAPLGSHQLDSYGQTFKVIDYSANDPEQKPYVVVKGGGDNQKIYLQLDESMVNDLKSRLPRKVFTY